MKIQIRLRAPNGQQRLEVDDTSPLSDLLKLIEEKTELKKFSLKYGYPLKTLDNPPETPVNTLNLRGENIVVAPLESSIPNTETQVKVAQEEKKPFVPKGIEPDETSLEWPERGGYMVLRVMPDDNSCMFTALGGALGISNPSELLRQQVAQYIFEHPLEYDKAILGDEPARYTGRMLQSDTWGGAIELSILSAIYDLEISSIDVKSLRVDRFGEGKSERVIILYSGIHYDRIAFALDLSMPVEVDVTKWRTDDDEVLEKARQLAQQLQRMHYYTDTTDFVIKCEICNWIGQGTKQAAAHEKETGHGRFGEMQIE
ncbi:ubiquitin thioesterase OTU1 [Diplogelasinospora grovesii]|uniref:Ubiquitin thioesterase OTU n=1 Tax=Diplogelasinospora grovesii TaxID=303347 RepID=A0AAN6N0E0_9PEZI|nr:ubiquitin thioesterase OTU1 [Diplogelasinospora grovesii]